MTELSDMLTKAARTYRVHFEGEIGDGLIEALRAAFGKDGPIYHMGTPFLVIGLEYSVDQPLSLWPAEPLMPITRYRGWADLAPVRR